MPYVHCMEATVATMNHRLDNVVEGTMTTDEGEIEFATRGHVIKAVNRHYRCSDWKPRVGETVMVDGDLAAGRITIDHIEPTPIDADAPIMSHPHLCAIADAIAAGCPPKEVRMRREGDTVRLRLCAAASRVNARGVVEEELVHGRLDLATGAWRIASRRRADGALATTGIDGPIGIVLARAAGRELLVGETAAETAEVDRRIAKATRTVGLSRPPRRSGAVAAPRAARVPEAPPFDDCPF